MAIFVDMEQMTARSFENQEAMQLQEPHRTRPIRFIELWQEANWKLKVYGIAYQRPLPRPELIQAAKRVAPMWKNICRAS